MLHPDSNNSQGSTSTTVPLQQQQLVAQTLQLLVQGCQPRVEDYHARAGLLQRLSKCLGSVKGVESVELRPYGSFISGFYNHSSDLDVAFLGFLHYDTLDARAQAHLSNGQTVSEWVPLHNLDKGTRLSILRRAANKLLDWQFVRSRQDIEYVLHARVPILKFTDLKSGVEVDLCIGSNSTPFKAFTVQQISKLSPAFRVLFWLVFLLNLPVTWLPWHSSVPKLGLPRLLNVLQVKAWAKAQGLNDGPGHTFNSWCITLLVICFLQQQQPALLPPLYTLFYNEPPPASRPRLLQVPDVDTNIEKFLQVLTLRVPTLTAQYSAIPFNVLQLFQGFLTSYSQQLQETIDNRDRVSRLCPWFATCIEDAAFDKPYAFLVEDPFDNRDNTARTLGGWDDGPGTIHFILQAFQRSSAQLSQLTSLPQTSWAAPLVSLFGPELLSLLAQPHLVTLGVPAELQPAQWLHWRDAAGRAERWRRLLRELGSQGDIITFEDFKEQNNIRALNERMTAAEVAEREEAKRQKELRKREKKMEKLRQKVAAKQAAKAAAAVGAAVATGMGQAEQDVTIQTSSSSELAVAATASISSADAHSRPQTASSYASSSHATTSSVASASFSHPGSRRKQVVLQGSGNASSASNAINTQHHSLHPQSPQHESGDHQSLDPVQCSVSTRHIADEEQDSIEGQRAGQKPRKPKWTNEQKLAAKAKRRGSQLQAVDQMAGLQIGDG